ncbi:MAG: WG repeat-containing protein [Planctomycetota bacterium]
MFCRSRLALSAVLLGAVAWAFAPQVIGDQTTWLEYYEIYSRQDTIYDDALPNSELFAAKVNHRWGIVDQRGVLITLPIFQWTDDGQDGRARAIVDGKTGYINGVGDWLIEPRFDWLDRYQDGLAIFRERGREGLIDQRGRVVLNPRYEAMLRFRENYAAVQENSRIGFINRSMKTTIKPQFAVARSFHQGLAAVQFFDDQGNVGDWGFVNIRGDVKWRDTTGTVTELRDFNDNLAAFRVEAEDGVPRWGYLNRKFEIAIAPRFAQARDFTNHLAAVATYGGDTADGESTHGGWGFINRAGDWELAPQFDWADDFDDRFAMIRYQGKFGFVDRRGTRGLFPEFADAEPFENGFAVVSDGTNLALVNDNGGVLFDPGDVIDAEPRNAGTDLGRKGPDLRGVPIVDRSRGTRAFFARYPRTQAVPYRRLFLEDGAPDIPVPYEPEFRYEERLPRAKGGGLMLESVQETEDDEGNRTEVVEPQLEGVIPEGME